MIVERPAILWKPVLDKEGKDTGAVKDASHIDQNGVLHSSSASMITNFDERTPFGCPSKMWHAEVAGIQTPQSEVSHSTDSTILEH